MQRLDDAKRAAIIKTAARLFARSPYHEVRLDDVAASAKIGKGTVYLYFKNKEDLYDSLVLDGFSRAVDRLRELAAEPGAAWERLERLICELVKWAIENPHFFQMMRRASSEQVRPKLSRKRKELGELFEGIIRQGIAEGVLDDPAPELTGQFIPAFVRSAVKFGPGNLPAEDLVRHILRVLGRGIRSESK
jgi:AcrR family transcriptional regulator